MKKGKDKVGFPELLFLVFLLLKLGELGQVKDWSYWFVFSPILVKVVFYVALAIISPEEK